MHEYCDDADITTGEETMENDGEIDRQHFMCQPLGDISSSGPELQQGSSGSAAGSVQPQGDRTAENVSPSPAPTRRNGNESAAATRPPPIGPDASRGPRQSGVPTRLAENRWPTGVPRCYARRQHTGTRACADSARAPGARSGADSPRSAYDGSATEMGNGARSSVPPASDPPSLEAAEDPAV